MLPWRFHGAGLCVLNKPAYIAIWSTIPRIEAGSLDNLAAKLSKAGTNLLMTGALAAAGFNADLPAQPQTAVNTICALLGWVPMLVAAVMLVVVCFHPIEKEMTAMERGKEA